MTRRPFRLLSVLLLPAAMVAVQSCLPGSVTLPQSPALKLLERKSSRIAFVGMDGNVHTSDQGGALKAITTDASVPDDTTSDLSQCGLCNAEAEIILEGEGSLLHSLAYKYVIEAIRERFPDDIRPGDVFLDNDPYAAASHLPDVYLAWPVFHEGRLVVWAVSGGHMIDVGGRVPGSCAGDSTETYQESLRIPPIKLVAGGA